MTRELLFRCDCDHSSESFVTFGPALALQERPLPQTMHAHRPFELILALSGDFQLQVPGCEPKRRTRYVVAPLQRHAILESSGPLARLYVDPGTRYVSRDRDLQAPSDTPELTQMLLRLHLDPSLALATEIIGYWKRSWVGWLGEARAYDDRALTALNHLDDLNVPNANRRTVAAMVDLSPSRFAAVFQQETGMPIRRYILWRRLLLACRLIREGKPVTDAAMESGFSDGAHLSRVYRGTFGSPPSALRKIDVSPAIPTGRRDAG